MIGSQQIKDCTHTIVECMFIGYLVVMGEVMLIYFRWSVCGNIAHTTILQQDTLQTIPAVHSSLQHIHMSTYNILLVYVVIACSNSI